MVAVPISPHMQNIIPHYLLNNGGCPHFPHPHFPHFPNCPHFPTHFPTPSFLAVSCVSCGSCRFFRFLMSPFPPFPPAVERFVVCRRCLPWQFGRWFCLWQGSKNYEFFLR